MVSHVKQLSEDERIRLQCQAREDYERRMIGEYNRGKQDGVEQGIEQGIEQGMQQGIQQGIQQGKTMLLIEGVKAKIARGKSIEQIASELEVEQTDIQKFYDTINANKSLSAEEVYQICVK